MLEDMGLVYETYESETGASTYGFTNWLWKYVYYRMPLIR